MVPLIDSVLERTTKPVLSEPTFIFWKFHHFWCEKLPVRCKNSTKSTVSSLDEVLEEYLTHFFYMLDSSVFHESSRGVHWPSILVRCLMALLNTPFYALWVANSWPAVGCPKAEFYISVIINLPCRQHSPGWPLDWLEVGRPQGIE